MHHWTNKSVLAFAKGADPVHAMINIVRQFTLNAMDQGWSGPPFDPIQLADILKISVVPRNDIYDARSVPLGRNFVQIQFNPTRPRGRIRFSLAHEIAHSFFPDCTESIRNRAPHRELPGDDWQLELLCNIGAAEMIMPLGSLSAQANELELLGIDQVLSLRRDYDVSVEAILMRVVSLTKKPCAIFCASRTEKGPRKSSYKVDYLIPSCSWSEEVTRGMHLPSESVVTECTAIGYTAKGKETWSTRGPELFVECVGIPGFPGGQYPRVAGIIKPTSTVDTESFGITYLRGNALEPRGNRENIIAHIVNDRTANWGGRGFAAALRKFYPDIQADFREWVASAPDMLKLGNIHHKDIDNSLSAVHMIAQKGYGQSVKPRIRYIALKSCLEQLSKIAKEKQAVIHMPRIGTGYAGGSWPVIEEMLIQELCHQRISVYVYDLPETITTSN